MYSRLSTWQTTDHLTLFMNLLWVMVWIYPRSSLHPSRVVRSLQEGSLPLPKYTRQGLGEVGTEFYINIQYEFLLRNWIKLALRWLSTLGEKAPTRFKKKKKKSHQFFTGQIIFGGTTQNWKCVMYAVPYTFLPLSAVLGLLLSRLHWVTVWSQQKQEKHAGAQNCSTTVVVCLLLERLKSRQSVQDGGS